MSRFFNSFFAKKGSTSTTSPDIKPAEAPQHSAMTKEELEKVIVSISKNSTPKTSSLIKIINLIFKTITAASLSSENLTASLNPASLAHTDTHLDDATDDTPALNLLSALCSSISNNDPTSFIEDNKKALALIESILQNFPIDQRYFSFYCSLYTLYIKNPSFKTSDTMLYNAILARLSMINAQRTNQHFPITLETAIYGREISQPLPGQFPDVLGVSISRKPEDFGIANDSVNNLKNHFLDSFPETFALDLSKATLESWSPEEINAIKEAFPHITDLILNYSETSREKLIACINAFSKVSSLCLVYTDKTNASDVVDEKLVSPKITTLILTCEGGAQSANNFGASIKFLPKMFPAVTHLLPPNFKNEDDEDMNSLLAIEFRSAKEPSPLHLVPLNRKGAKSFLLKKRNPDCTDTTVNMSSYSLLLNTTGTTSMMNTTTPSMMMSITNNSIHEPQQKQNQGGDQDNPDDEEESNLSLQS